MNSLWQSLAAQGPGPVRGHFHGRHGTVALQDLAHASILDGRLESLRGRSIVLAMREQFAAAVALLELDGIARRIVLCTPDLKPEQLAGVCAAAGADAVLDSVSAQPLPENVDRRASENTEWILLTSGTTGEPKLVLHTLESLAGTLPRQPASVSPMVWSTFYDIRRYGGLQIYLRAVLSGSPLVLSSAGEPTREFLVRVAAAKVTHMSGTPSHWRSALMSGDSGLIAPEYVRLSGEVADQTILDQLRAVWPHARVAHAFASTEAGVAFDVNDGLAGFPAELIGQSTGGIELKVQDGTLWIRSGRTAARYVGGAPASIADAEGYVDTGDMVELANGRFYFRGRRGGIINVGGLKVYPEEVESVLNADPRVRMSLVKARRNPITGSLVVAEVVLAEDGKSNAAQDTETVKNELLNACRRTLAAHKVPALLRFVPALELSAAGKLVRPVRNVLVSGGSRGLGLAMSRALAAAGYRVIAVARSLSAELTAARATAAAEGRGAIEFRACDLSDLSLIAPLVRGIRSDFGPVYGLINNAGLGTSGLLSTMSDQQIQRLIQLNTVSPIVLSKYVVRSMMTHREGRIVNIASIVAATGYRGLSVYSATKASLIGFTRSLAREVGPLGITVNALSPGFVDTEMTHELTESQREKIARRSALNRMPEPIDIANSVEFLLGEGGRNITGTVITIDAGNTA